MWCDMMRLCAVGMTEEHRQAVRHLHETAVKLGLYSPGVCVGEGVGAAAAGQRSCNEPFTVHEPCAVGMIVRFVGRIGRGLQPSAACN